MRLFSFQLNFVVAILLLFILLSCDKEDSSPTSSSTQVKKANCVFSSHIVKTIISGTVGQPAQYTTDHTSTIQNQGDADANDVKIIVYVNGSSVSSLNVTGRLTPHQSINYNFQTVTIGGNADCRLQWN